MDACATLDWVVDKPLENSADGEFFRSLDLAVVNFDSIVVATLAIPLFVAPLDFAALASSVVVRNFVEDVAEDSENSQASLAVFALLTVAVAVVVVVVVVVVASA